MQANYSYIPSRRRLIAFHFGTAQNQPQQSSDEFDKLLKANTPLAVWLIFLGIGGGLLARYYLRIHYLPDMEWNAALVYLFICSVWGGVIGLLLTISLYLPGVIWSELIVFETTMDNHLTYSADHDDSSGKRSKRKEACIRSIMIWLGIPFFGILVASHLSLRASEISVIKKFDFYLVVAGVILVATFFGMRGIFRFLLQRTEKRYNDEEKKTISRQIFRYAIWFTLSVLLNQVAMYVIYVLAGRTPRRDDFLILTALCSFFVWLSTQVVAARHRYYPRQALIAALVTAVVLLFWADQFSDLSMKLMSRYGVGESNEFRIVVNEKGSKVLEDLGFTKDTRRLEKVSILSRMGDHYFVRLGAHSFTLPKEDVESIHRYDDSTIR